MGLKLFSLTQLLSLLFLHSSSSSSSSSYNNSHLELNPTTYSCNLFQGSWIYDPTYFPLYDPFQCPFIDPGLNCQKNGRPDYMYLKFRWTPSATNCYVSRFDGKKFLERYRGKKVMFVGDSLSSNQWQSLACMLHAVVPNANYMLSSRGSVTTLTFPDYEFSTIYVKNGFFVSLTNRTLKLDTLIRSELWSVADVLIFNSYHWWLHAGRYRTWDNYQIGNTTFYYMDVMEAYKTALTTWANFIDTNVDPAKTRVFYQGISPVHFRGREWNEPRLQDCRSQTMPIYGSRYPGQIPPGDAVVRSVLSNMKKPAILLDILLLSQLRKDGHPSVYGGGGMDCSHWCVAGVTDTWNHLLYSLLMT